MTLPARIYAAVAPDGLIKIGVSRDPSRRITQLNRRGKLELLMTTTPCDDAHQIERTAHRLLALLGKQVAGEWFQVTKADVLEAIEQARKIVRGDELKLDAGAVMVTAAEVGDEFHAHAQATDDDTTTLVSMRMEDDLRAQVDAVARAEDRTFSQQMHRIIREWLAAREVPKKGGK